MSADSPMSVSADTKWLRHLEDYLRKEMSEGKIDFHIRSRIDEQTRVRFYIHPQGQSGETQDYTFVDGLLAVDTIDREWPDGR